ncbi:MAG TPA: hypothetical protein VGN63_16250 [Flavisolibacter sp.]|jgi:hypothetical protein|nr:hypothetical protein [Flavisolibacter sp.]
MKTLLTALLISASAFAFSQKVINVDKMEQIPLNTFYTVSGSPVVTARFVRLVEGTPYFSNKWMNGVALADNGDRYRSPRVKLDLLDNQLYFLNNDEQEFVCTLPLKELTLTDTVSGQTYAFVHSSTLKFAPAKKGWYQKLVEGKASLYRNFNKIVNEDMPYGSSVSEQRIATTEEFFIVYKGAWHSAKKPKDVPAILSDKKKELEQYLQTEAVKKGSNTEKITALVTYYNSL